MRELALREMEGTIGGSWTGLAVEIAKDLIAHFKQDNGGPSATWENNGGYVG